MNQVQEIKNRLDIVEVIRGYLRLEKAGSNFKGLCPFHSEKTPSFFVSPAKQMWYCFGCNRGGDSFAFVQAIDNVEFLEALKILADKAGVVLKKEDPKMQSARTRMYQIIDAAASFFEQQLGEYPAASSYLHQRGLKDNTIENFRLGWAPDSWDALSMHLRRAGFSDSEMTQSGLAILSTKPQSTSRVYDRFRGRIMFPVFDHQGKPVGFAGRILKDSLPDSKQVAEPKYVNTPNTLIYDKGKILFGFHEAKQHIREKDQVVLVEGNMDFLLSWQAGVQNVVASSGTALTSDHLMVVRRLCSSLLSCFDMDEAGQTATKRSIDLALAQGFQVKVIQLGQDAKDPADLIVRSPEKWSESIAAARPVMDYYFEKTLAKHDAFSPEGKKLIASILLPEVNKLASKIEQAHWLGVLSDNLHIKEPVLEEEMKAASRKAPQDAPAIQKSSETSRKPKLEMLLERAIFILQGGLPEAPPLDLLKNISLPDSLAGKVLAKMINVAPFEKREIASALDAHENEFLDYVVFKNEILGEVQDPEKEFVFCVRSIAEHMLKERLTGLAWKIKDAESRNESIQLSELSAEFNEASKRLAELFKE
jgi:DNA primase